MKTTGKVGKPRIQDEFTHIPCRVKRFQLRQKRDGLCILCAEPLATKWHCLRHAIAARERAAKRIGRKRKFDCRTRRLAKAVKLGKA